LSCTNNDSARVGGESTSLSGAEFRNLAEVALVARASNRAEDFAGFLTNDFVRVSNGRVEAEDKDGYLIWMSAHSRAFPDGVTDLEILGVDGRKVFTEWSFEGTHSGHFGELAPSNKLWSSKGFSVWTFDEIGLVEREDVYFDELSVMTQLGFSLVPPGPEE